MYNLVSDFKKTICLKNPFTVPIGHNKDRLTMKTGRNVRK